MRTLTLEGSVARAACRIKAAAYRVAERAVRDDPEILAVCVVSPGYSLAEIGGLMESAVKPDEFHALMERGVVTVYPKGSPPPFPSGQLVNCLRIPPAFLIQKAGGERDR